MSASMMSTISSAGFERSPAPEPQPFNYRQNAAVYIASEQRPANIIIPKHRDAGIGGYSNIYSHSGIGGHVKQHRDMGIGKACLSQSPSRQQSSAQSPSPALSASSSSSSSPFKRVLSFASLRSMTRSSSNTKSE
ncbi:hypothetical protein FB639_002870 [Coemansia asiatica]|nr:hypothetical protein FB639_002870 [Coemansia asiatica]